jgi:hypothetical protein
MIISPLRCRFFYRYGVESETSMSCYWAAADFSPGVDHTYTAKGFLRLSHESHQRLLLLLVQIDIGALPTISSERPNP